MNQIFIRLTTPDDFEFLRELFATTRPDLVGAVHLPEEMRAQLVDKQFELQCNHYRQNFPGGHFGIIQYGNTRIGRFDLNRTDKEIHLLELALMPEYRESGIGSQLLEALKKEAVANQQAIRLHVEKNNPAVEFYQRHGFAQIGEKEAHFEMQWPYEPPHSIEQKSDADAV